MEVIQSFDGVDLAFERAGTQEPALIFIHGFGGNRQQFKTVFQTLAAHHQVIVLDLPGHGDSGRQRSSWTLANFANDVTSVMDACALDRAILIGHSMGGMVMVEVAAKNPSRITGLIAVDTLHNMEQLFPEGAIDTLIQAIRADFKGAMTQFAASLLNDKVAASIRNAIIDGFTAMHPEVAIQILESIKDYHLPLTTQNMPIPLAFINTDFQATHVEAGRKFFPVLNVEILKGLSHFPHLEAPELFQNACNRAINFIATHQL